MKIGYARVSTKDQNLDLQINALTSAGCELIFQEKVGATKDRPELEKMIDHLRDGDTVIVWKLDRLGRTLKNLVGIISDFNNAGINFISLQDNIDTTNSHGKLIFHIFSSFAEFEHSLIRERTLAGLDAARQKGRFGGRPKGLSAKNKKIAKAALNLTKQGSMTVTEIRKSLSISKASYYRYLEYAKSQEQKTNP